MTQLVGESEWAELRCNPNYQAIVLQRVALGSSFFPVEGQIPRQPTKGVWKGETGKSEAEVPGLIPTSSLGWSHRLSQRWNPWGQSRQKLIK